MRLRIMQIWPYALQYMRIYFLICENPHIDKCGLCAYAHAFSKPAIQTNPSSCILKLIVEYQIIT